MCSLQKSRLEGVGVGGADKEEEGAGVDRHGFRRLAESHEWVRLKLLQKFGFKGRLGKAEDGVSRPIEVLLRPKGMGLGNMSEMVNLPANKEFEKGLKAQDSHGGGQLRYFRCGGGATFSTFRLGAFIYCTNR